ncbi:MAG: permease-like cell division protein FtsX [Bacteroidales bacterium]|nr:permease-like cell division protein FtsX [Bacteroidales bacterium]
MEQTETMRPTVSKFYRRKLLMSTFSTTLCIALVLYMSGLFFMLIFNTQHISDMFRSNIKLTITLNDNSSLASIEMFRKQLATYPFVRESKFISKDVAADELKEELGEDFVALLDGNNPLMSRIEVKLNSEYATLDSIKSLSRHLKTNNVVDEVNFPHNVWRNSTSVLNKVSTIVFTLSLVLLVITIIFISNTVRLQMSGNRFDIRTAKLIGASTWTITKPYLKRALIQSVVAIVLSTVGLTLTVKFIEKIVDGVVTISAFPTTLMVMAVAGFAISLLTTWYYSRKYMLADEDELYY